MSGFRPQVNIVTAFGRGDGLACALHQQGFQVKVFDFTSAFGPEYERGEGPFPLVRQAYLPTQQALVDEVDPLPRGLALWLSDGPLELGGPMAPFFKSTRAEVKGLASPSDDFESDWLRRFLRVWTSPRHMESWAVSKGSSFPASPETALGLVPSFGEARFFHFDRWRESGQPIHACQSLVDINFNNSQVTEFVVQDGQATAHPAARWVWCLSSQETEVLNADLAQRLFHRGVAQPEWLWVSFRVSCEHGPWVGGFPDYMVILGDIRLPWTHANMAVLRRWGVEGFKVWMKVPAQRIRDEQARQAWASDLQNLLNKRLALAKWRVSTETWSISPQAPVFASSEAENLTPRWKNFDWIAPETLPRLDLSARWEREAEVLRRLESWRNEQMRKQGAVSDSALHAP